MNLVKKPSSIRSQRIAGRRVSAARSGKTAGGRSVASRFAFSVPWILVLGLAVGTANELRAENGAAGEEPPAGWEESAGLQLVVADSLDSGGRIFDAPDFQHTLVVPGGGDQAYLLTLRKQTVSLLPKKSLQWDAQDQPLPDLAAGSELGTFINDEGLIRFDTAGGSIEVRPEPPLVGLISAEKLAAAKPDYVERAKKYEPNPTAVAALKKLDQDTKILVFFGTWCSYCKHWLPTFMKTIEVVDNPRISVEYYGMSEDQSEPAGPLQTWNVGLTPTFIVVQGNRELGRIEEEPLVSIEEDLAKILGLQ
jgi:thioredoxin 1